MTSDQLRGRLYCVQLRTSGIQTTSTQRSSRVKYYKQHTLGKHKAKYIKILNSLAAGEYSALNIVHLTPSWHQRAKTRR